MGQCNEKGHLKLFYGQECYCFLVYRTNILHQKKLIAISKEEIIYGLTERRLLFGGRQTNDCS